MSISEDMLEAVKVVFLKQIFEEDFPECGMKAWLTMVEKDTESDCWILYFDFSEFESENDKYFIEVYYANIHTPKDGRILFTAKEAGMYRPKYSAFFGDTTNGVSFEDQISEYLEEV
jgi:hypothetical protein